MHGGEARQVVYAHKARDRRARYCATQGVDACRRETVHRTIAVSIDRLSRHDIITRLTQARLLPAVLHYGRSSRPVYAHKRGGPTGAAAMRVFPLDDAARGHASHSGSQVAPLTRECRVLKRRSCPPRPPQTLCAQTPGSPAPQFVQRKGSAPRHLCEEQPSDAVEVRTQPWSDPTAGSAPRISNTPPKRASHLRHLVYAHKPIVRMANA